ncbi:hypothetical protein D3C75_1268230 [compost metagenome]
MPFHKNLKSPLASRANPYYIPAAINVHIFQTQLCQALGKFCCSFLLITGGSLYLYEINLILFGLFLIRFDKA